MTVNGKIRAIDMRFLDDLFAMGGGYVLDFTNLTFAEFFEDELGINIDEPRYEAEGTSKARRLRYFLRTADRPTVVRTLLALWEYREADRRRSGLEETVLNAEEEFFHFIKRLGGKPPTTNKPPVSAETLVVPDQALVSKLSAKLTEVSQLKPQERGYAFERFLKELFDASGLGARASFRLRGEQIDGSFELDSEVYLLEARWRNEQAANSDLLTFAGKIAGKAQWSRGLFVSYAGFSEDGLQGFSHGRPTNLIGLDGLDLYHILSGTLDLREVLRRKARRAAETNRVFVPVRELFPNVT